MCPFYLRVSLFLCATFAALSAGCSADVSDSGPSQANPLDGEEQAVVDGLNQLRQGKSLGAVKECASLNVAAAAHADDMRNQQYLNEESPDGTSARSRACKAGYTPACGSAGVAEAVASGTETGADVLAQWEADTKTEPVLLGPTLTVVGIGRSLGGEEPIWSMELATDDDPSCAN